VSESGERHRCTRYGVSVGSALDQLLDAGGVKCTYRISAKGQVESVSVSCPRPNRFVHDTCVRVIKSTKFPPEAAWVFAALHATMIFGAIAVIGFLLAVLSFICEYFRSRRRRVPSQPHDNITSSA
jgi:hypothetical protein